MRKAARHSDGVDSSNPRRWRGEWLHHHGGGVCWLFVLLWMDLWRHKLIVCKKWYKNNLKMRLTHYFLIHVGMHHTVSLLLLHKWILPRDQHQLPCMWIMVDHVEPRAFALCFLNFPPPVHGILNTTVQLCPSCLAFSSSPESPRETVIRFDVVGVEYQLRILILHLPKEEMK
jgi:hypothetical protein